jgi:hypothetical protein
MTKVFRGFSHFSCLNSGGGAGSRADSAEESTAVELLVGTTLRNKPGESNFQKSTMENHHWSTLSQYSTRMVDLDVVLPVACRRQLEVSGAAGPTCRTPITAPPNQAETRMAPNVAEATPKGPKFRAGAATNRWVVGIIIFDINALNSNHAAPTTLPPSQHASEVSNRT